MTLLFVSDLSASYESSRALFDVNLQLRQGEAVALMGRNGMGKSTTVKCICRLMPAQGTLMFASTDLLGLPAHRAARLGIGLVPEGRRCFAGLTVYENLMVAARPGDWNFKQVVQLFPRLGERIDQLSASLSGGEQQMLAIGRALMTNPKLLILDEATEGLAPIVRQEICSAINDLKARTGLSILVIDKSLGALKNICDSAVIVERGRTVWQGRMPELTPCVTQKYIGV